MSTLTPRVVVVHRRTELAELVARHGTVGQARFFLTSRGQDLDELQHRADADAAALATVAAAVPAGWRQGRVERGDLDRFLFSPEDVVVVVGQDGLVANVAKYLTGQPVLGVNPDPERNPGVLVRHAADEVAGVLPGLVAELSQAVEGRGEELTMVEARTDDGQRLLALNEVFVGPASHQTARWTLSPAQGVEERQATSGLIVATGTGSTGWCASLALERHSDLPMPRPQDGTLAWFVREAWPSPTTGTTHTQGLLPEATSLTVRAESDGLVVFGDGIESDHLTLAYGQVVTVHRAPAGLRLR